METQRSPWGGGGEGPECQKNGGDYKIYQTVSSVAFAGVSLEIHRKLNSATTICLEIFAPDLLCLSCYPPSPLTVKTQITEQHFWKFKFFVWVPTSATKLILFNNFLLLMVHCSVLTQYTVYVYIRVYCKCKLVYHRFTSHKSLMLYLYPFFVKF